MSDKAKTAVSKSAGQRTNAKGSIYDRIAVAREKRDALTPAALTTGKQTKSSSKSVESAAVVANLRGNDQTTTEPVEAKSRPKPALPEVATAPLPANDPEEPDSRKPGVFLWVASVVIAVFLFGYVAVNSRIQSDVIVSSVIAPAQPTLTVDPVAQARQSLPGDAGGPILAISQEAPVQTAVSVLESDNPVSPTLATLDTQNAPLVVRAVDVAGIRGVQTAPASGIIATRFPETSVRPNLSTLEAPNSRIETLGFDASRIRVVLNLPSSRPASLLSATESALEAAGFTVQSQRVNLAISKSNVRYFHSQDQEAARVLAESIDAQVRDFTGFRPSPKIGLVEVWMSGRSVTRTAADDKQNAGPFTELGSELRRLRQNIQRALRGS